MNHYLSLQPNPTTINYNWLQPMQITVDQNANSNYPTIAKDFLEKYALASNYGISYTGHFYNSTSFVTIYVHQGQLNHLHETVGYTNYINKLVELGINLIKYQTITHSAQPIGKNNVLVTFYGQAEINGRNYQIKSVFVIRIISGSYRIINHVLDVFI